MNERKDRLVGVHLNMREFQVLEKYSRRVYLRPSTALKQVFFQFLDEHDDFRDILQEGKFGT
ncbi:MAG: hypothetical protein QXZ17_13500 [Nitrososphaerota archaeon]